MTLSAFLFQNRPTSAEQEDLQRCRIYRDFFPNTEIALPAIALRNRAIAKWVRGRRVAVCVHTGTELAAAIAAGTRLPQVTVYADALDESDLLRAVNLGVGRVVVGSVEHIQLLRSGAVKRAQDVIIRMTDLYTPDQSIADRDDRVGCGFRFDSDQADAAIAMLLDHEWLNLVGLYCEVGLRDHDFVSFPAAIGHMIAEMEQVRRNHGKVLTWLGLGGGRAVTCGRLAVELPILSAQIDESLNDACATLQFPQPSVILSTGLGIVGQTAA